MEMVDVACRWTGPFASLLSPSRTSSPMVQETGLDTRCQALKSDKRFRSMISYTNFIRSIIDIFYSVHFLFQILAQLSEELAR